MIRTARLVMLLLLCIVLAAAGGCRLFATDKPEPYTEAKPGPWKNVKTSILFDASKTSVKITIMVKDYPARPGDYVRKFDLIDGKERNIGQRVFAYGAEPQETFILKPTTKQVTVIITATSRGEWRSNPRLVPPLK